MGVYLSAVGANLDVFLRLRDSSVVSSSIREPQLATLAVDMTRLPTSKGVACAVVVGVVGVA
jgi:hypothetical protein